MVDTTRINVWYKASIWFAISPLVIGILIYLIWLKTKADFLMDLGLFTILFGLLCILIALVCLIVFGIKSAGREKKGLARKFLAALFIILINFPAAFAIIVSVGYEESTYNITIRNNSNYAVERFVILERQKETLIGDINSGDVLRKNIHFWHEGTVIYKFILEGKEYTGLLFGYVTTGLSFSAEIVITEGKEVKIQSSG